MNYIKRQYLSTINTCTEMVKEKLFTTQILMPDNTMSRIYMPGYHSIRHLNKEDIPLTEWFRGICVVKPLRYKCPSLGRKKRRVV